MPPWCRLIDTRCPARRTDEGDGQRHVGTSFVSRNVDLASSLDERATGLINGDRALPVAIRAIERERTSFDDNESKTRMGVPS